MPGLDVKLPSWSECLECGVVRQARQTLDRVVYRCCRKFRFWGQNLKIWYQKFNDVQTSNLSKKQICDSTAVRQCSPPRVHASEGLQHIRHAMGKEVQAGEGVSRTGRRRRRHP